MIVKNLYRYPLMIALPQKACERVEYLQRNMWATKMFTALTIAVVESYILCPLERFKVLFITHNREPDQSGYRSYLKEFRHNLGGELFKGVTPLMAR